MNSQSTMNSPSTMDLASYIYFPTFFDFVANYCPNQSIEQSIQQYYDLMFQYQIPEYADPKTVHTAQIVGKVVTNPPVPLIADCLTRNAETEPHPPCHTNNRWMCSLSNWALVCGSSFPNDKKNQIFHIQPNFTKTFKNSIVRYIICLPNIEYDDIYIKVDGRNFTVSAPFYRKIYRKQNPTQIVKGDDPNRRDMHYRMVYEYALNDYLPEKALKIVGNPSVLFYDKSRMIVNIQVMPVRYL